MPPPLPQSAYPVALAALPEAPVAEVAPISVAQTPIASQSAFRTPVGEPAPSSAQPVFAEAALVVEQPVFAVIEPLVEPAPVASSTPAGEARQLVPGAPEVAHAAPSAEAAVMDEGDAEADAASAPAAASEPAAGSAPLPIMAPSPVVEPQGAKPAAFTSSRSEMPVVLETPALRGRERTQRFWKQRSEWALRAQGWSQNTLRNAPRALVLSAPFIALFGVWLGHSLVPRHRHVPPATVSPANAAANQLAPAASALGVAKAMPASAPPAVLVAVAPKPSSAAPEAPLADSTELLHALTHGLPALESLAAKFPGDAQVAVALASQQARAQRFEAAVSTIEHALEVDPGSAQNGKVMSILWRAAQSPASEQTFLCLRKLGARGSDIAFDLATTSGVRGSVRERAKAELSNFLAFDTSADTRVAVALMLAPDCSTRSRLLNRAEAEGGKRTLSMLERSSRGGCTSSSDGACNACLMGSPELAHALAKLSAGATP